MKTEKNECILCGKTYQGFGNNALPLMKGLCCDECYSNKVIPERLKRFIKAPTHYIRTAKKFGTGGCHVVLPRAELGKEVIIMENIKIRTFQRKEKNLDNTLC